MLTASAELATGELRQHATIHRSIKIEREALRAGDLSGNPGRPGALRRLMRPSGKNGQSFEVVGTRDWRSG